MSDSGLPPSHSDDPEQRNRTVYEPGVQAFTPNNREGDYFIISRTEAVTDGSADQEGPPCQSSAAQLIPPDIRMGGQESHMGESMESQSLSSVQGEQYPAMRLQQAGTPVDPVHQTRSLGRGNTATSGSGTSSGGLACFDDTSTETVKMNLPQIPPDADLKWRGIPEGIDTEEDPEETRLKTVFQCPDERNPPQMPPTAHINTAEDCTVCIGFLLDNAGVRDRGIRQKKQQILTCMLPTSSQFLYKTIIGLVEVMLPNFTHEQLQSIRLQPQHDPHRTCVHILVEEMKSEGKRLGHLVEYFWANDSKRVDILKDVREIHHGCPYCDSIFQQLP